MKSNKTDGVQILAGTKLARIRHVLFDLDGTLYRGSELFPWTKETLAILKRLDVGFTYLTNNSSRSAADYLEKIRRLELPGTAENIFTSSLATLAVLQADYPTARRIFLLGTESLRREFIGAGYEILAEEDDRPPDVVVVAFDTDLVYRRLCQAAWWVKSGIPYLATHPDKICPTDLQTVLVDCGAICDAIHGATGRDPDLIPGKPNRRMIDGICARYSLAPEETAMVGDRLYTDLEMARRAGVVGVLVLSGEATEEDLARTDLHPEVVAETVLDFARALESARDEETADG